MDTTSNQLSAPYCSTSSSSPPPGRWDVFLSFRGKDTRRNFTAHLYKALDQAGILTFRDDPALEKGEEISPALLEAIHSSKKFVVVLSENYADSTWCLNELVEILICCKRRKNHVVIPVFYYVGPSDLRHQKGRFGETLDVHKNPKRQKRYSDDMMEKWKSALAEIGKISGYHLSKDANENEADTIQKIVEAVAPPKVLHQEEYLIGIDSDVEVIHLKLKMESTDVRAIVIWGLGGIGKTTIATAFFNKYCSKYGISCFIENVKQYSLLSLLEKLLIELLRKKDYKVPNLNSGIKELQKILPTKKALIVLDDMEQLDLLVKLRNLFSPGSRIVITTKDTNLLNQLKMDISEVDAYEVKVLGEIESLELFNYHAFRKTVPPKNLRELSKGFVSYAGGLPLALKVLGSSLRGRTEVSFWKAKLEIVGKFPENEIQSILQVGFDGLDNQTQKDIFLDIVFFFIGQDKDEVVHIFNSCGFYPNVGIPILVDRCLLTIDKDNRFHMHNLIQDMGREVIREESRQGKCRRVYLCPGNARDALRNKEPLTTLKLINVSYSQNLKRTPDFKYLKLVEKLLLRGCNNLLEVHPSIGQLSNLYHLDLGQCYNLKELCEAIGQLTELGHLDLRGCVNLKRLPEPIKQLSNLGRLDLGRCRSLKRLPEQLGDMKGLKMIDASDTAIEQLPDSIGRLNNLVDLKLGWCENLTSLPNSIWKLKLLEVLDLGDCMKLERLPEQLEKMKSVEEIPDSIGLLSRLRELNLRGCRKLESITSLQILGTSSFKAHLPNSWEIPEWLSYQSSGCTVTLEIPPILGDNFWGIALSLVYKCKIYGMYTRYGSYIRAVVKNKTEGITNNYKISVYTPYTSEVQSRIECTRRGDEISVKSGDIIKVSFQTLLYSTYSDHVVGELKVKMCGAHVIQKTSSTPYL